MLYPILWLSLLLTASPDDGEKPSAAALPPSPIVVDDFEADRPGAWPSKWRFLSTKKEEFRPLGEYMGDTEKFYVVQERGNKFLRAYTKAEAQRISRPDIEGRWSLASHPRIRWDWRALQLPPGAREDKVNDTGAALYVTFAKKDWLGRPLSLKYTYSSTLPVGTIISTGNVKVVVAASGAEGYGEWIRVERNVVQDYERAFGKEASGDPFTITLWSDSDDTRTVGEVDFDNLTLLPPR